MMKIIETWVLLVACVLAARADTGFKSDFETFETFPGQSSGRSQSLYPEPSSTFDFLDDDEIDRNKRFVDVDLSSFDRISPEPRLTKSKEYISPADAENRFTRDAPRYNSEYTDGYKAFLDKYFDKSEQERPNEYFTEENHGDGGDDKGASSQNKRKSAQNANYHRKPDDVEHVGEKSQDDGHDIDYNTSEYERIKALSKQQETEIKQNPKHCKVTVKNDMKCSVCKNPETGAHSESCSFSSTPEEKKYAYTKERNYNSKDNEKEDDDEDDGEEEEGASNKSEKQVAKASTPPPPTTSKPQRNQQQRRRGPQRSANQKSAALQQERDSPKPVTNRQSSQRRPKQRASGGGSSSSSTTTTTTSTTKKPVASTSHRYSASYKAEESRPQHRIIGLDPFLYGSHSSDKSEEEKEKPKRNTGESTGSRSYEDYFSHVFPEARNGRLQREEDEDEESEEQVEFLPNYDSKKNVEDVLAEFKTKDWSTCKKEIKDDLTCYHCKDDKGVRHEECMYVSGSAEPDKPKSSRLSYSETKEYHHPQDRESTEDEPNNASSKIVSKTSNSDNDSKQKKASRKLVVRKRKAKLQQQNVPRPEDVEDYHSGEKKSIKRMVTYRIENSGGRDAEPASSLVFEHQYSHDF